MKWTVETKSFKPGVRQVESIRRRNGMEERSARIQSSDLTDFAVKVVSDVAGNMGTKARTYHLG